MIVTSITNIADIQHNVCYECHNEEHATEECPLVATLEQQIVSATSEHLEADTTSLLCEEDAGNCYKCNMPGHVETKCLQQAMKDVVNPVNDESQQSVGSKIDSANNGSIKLAVTQRSQPIKLRRVQVLHRTRSFTANKSEIDSELSRHHEDT